MGKNEDKSPSKEQRLTQEQYRYLDNQLVTFQNWIDKNYPDLLNHHFKDKDSTPGSSITPYNIISVISYIISDAYDGRESEWHIPMPKRK